MSKRITLLSILITVMLFTCGCGSVSDTTRKEVNNYLPSDYGTYDWISPDGVHYWIYSGAYRYGIAPRYDKNGNLVVEEE